MDTIIGIDQLEFGEAVTELGPVCPENLIHYFMRNIAVPLTFFDKQAGPDLFVWHCVMNQAETAFDGWVIDSGYNKVGDFVVPIM